MYQVKCSAENCVDDDTVFPLIGAERQISAAL